MNFIAKACQLEGEPTRYAPDIEDPSPAADDAKYCRILDNALVHHSVATEKSDTSPLERTD